MPASLRVPIRALAAAAVWTAFACLPLAGCGSAAAIDPASARSAPDFPHQQAADWINSAPLSMKGLRGRVVVLDVWTFG